VLDVLAGLLHVSLRKAFLKPFLCAEGTHSGMQLFLFKPLTYMNRSGTAMPEILKRVGRPTLDRVLVVCDTLDLAPGQLRLKRQGSSAGHKGLASIIRALGREDFLRLYVGIGRPRDRQQVIDYVLAEPRREEALLLEEAVQRAAEAVLQLAEVGPEGVMNALNQRRAER
jgi:PTH1 family peptidyl-tRNA hydrolase